MLRNIVVELDSAHSSTCLYNDYIIIGANCLRTHGTVADLEALSRVLPENHNLPGLSWIFKDPQIVWGSQASWKVTWLQEMWSNDFES